MAVPTLADWKIFLKEFVRRTVTGACLAKPKSPILTFMVSKSRNRFAGFMSR